MIAKVIFEFQASEEMAVTKKSCYEEGLEAGARAFTYTVVMMLLN